MSLSGIAGLRSLSGHCRVMRVTASGLRGGVVAGEETVEVNFSGCIRVTALLFAPGALLFVDLSWTGVSGRAVVPPGCVFYDVSGTAVDSFVGCAEEMWFDHTRISRASVHARCRVFSAHGAHLLAEFVGGPPVLRLSQCAFSGDFDIGPGVLDFSVAGCIGVTGYTGGDSVEIADFTGTSVKASDVRLAAVVWI